MLQVCIRVDSLNNILNEIDSFSKKLEKVNSTLAMFLCAKIMTVTILSHLLGFFLPWVNRRCFYWEKKYWNKSTFFFRILCIACTIQGSLFSERYSHTTQIAAVNERSFFLSCVMSEGRRTYYTEKKRNYWDDIFIWKSFCRNIEINAIDLTAVVDSIIDFFPQSYSQM